DAHHTGAVEGQHVVVLLDEAFHAGRTHRHAGHRETADRRVLVDHAPDQVGRDVALDGIAAHGRRVAGDASCRHAEIALDVGEVVQVVRDDGEAVLTHVIDPCIAATAGRRLVDDDGV